MGNILCPECKKGTLVSRGKRYFRCPRCNYIRYKSPLGRRRGSTASTGGKRRGNLEEIPRIEEVTRKRRRRGAIPTGEGYHTQRYKDEKFLHDQVIRAERKRASVEKILRDLRRNKFSGLRKILIEGEIWDIETGRPLSREREKQRKREMEIEGALKDLETYEGEKEDE